MKKILCVLLCAVLLMGVLVSCNKKLPDSGSESVNDGAQSSDDGQLNDSGDDSQSTQTPTDSESNKKPAETETRKELTSENFSQNGVARDFNMMVRPNRYHYLWVEKDSAEQLAHGVYLRNSRLETDYGIKIKIYEPPIPAGSNAASPAAFINALSASTGEFDLSVPDYWWLLEHQGFFINLFDRDELGFNQGGLKQDYWYTQWNENTTINNKLFTVAGDASLEVLENIEVVYYNKGMTDSVEGGIDMYDLVDEHAWTLDEMNRIGKLFATGADTQATDDDIYGVMYDDHSSAAQMYASGIKLTEINEAGGISLVAKTAPLNSLIHEKVKSVILDTANKLHDSTARSDTNKTTFFVNGQSVFYANCLYMGSAITKKAADDFEFGILPQPLYAEGDDYISTSYGVSLFGIPKSSVDPHFAAVVLDAMNYHSWNTVVTAFFDATMKAQLASGSEDARMLDLAKNNLYFDFAWILQSGGKMTVHGAFINSLTDANKELASTLDSAMEVSVPGLGEIMMFYNQ